MREGRNVPLVQLDGHEVVGYAGGSVQGMVAGKAYVEEDVKAAVLKINDADVTNPESVPAAL